MMRTSEFINAVMLGGMLCMAIACSNSNPPSAETSRPENSIDAAASNTEIEPTVYQVKGVVQELLDDGITAMIRHEEIPDYMPAMTMPLRVKDSAEWDGVDAGDRIGFRMLVTDTEGWIDQVEVLEESVEIEFRPTTRIVREVEELKVGDPMPNYPLTNELGQAIQLQDYKGKALAFSFIFTRCPFPDFCPRMNNHFLQAYKLLKSQPDAPGNWHLLSISFDVEHDTPKVLRGYASQYDYDTNHWNFATGALIEIDAITEQFGMYFSRDEGTFNFSHNLRTVIVDANGIIHEILIGNEWTPEELAKAITKAARAESTNQGQL